MDRFETATSITQVDSHTYSATFPDEWCVGSVPNGGFITSCFMRVASLHFSTTLSKQSQPHTMTIHLEFLRRTQTGPAKFVVKDMKLGRQASIVHISLSQDGREEVVAYLSQADINAEKGLSFKTDWSLQPPPPPADTAKFSSGGCSNWVEQEKMPFPNFRKSSTRMKWFFPRQGQRSKSISDHWVCWTSGDNFTQESLGFVCDNFPLVVESYTQDRPYDVKTTQSGTANPPKKTSAWYPTLLLNLDVKKALPKEGAKYLFVRTQSKQIKNGRFDVEIIIMDETGDLVAISHHVVLVLGADRNTSARRTQGEKL